MKINVIAVGKPKQKFIQEESISYLRRLGSGLSTEITFLSDSTRMKDTSKAMENEEKLILKSVSDRDYVILLDERGKMMSSEDFSGHLFSLLENTSGKIAFVIGGPFGVTRSIRQRSDEMLSLSLMTVTHEMCLLLLSEQIYRAVMIERNSPYHHR